MVNKNLSFVRSYGIIYNAV